MNFKNYGWFFLAFFLSYSVQSDITTKVIYGEDGRKEFYEAQNVDQTISALGSVALVPKNLLVKKDSNYFFELINYGKKNDLCKEERFFNQSILPFCSGVLVTDQHILTAQHCMVFNCKNTSLVFRFRLNSKNSQRVSFSKDEVYQCDSVEYKGSEDNDIALIKLDRPVTTALALPLKHRPSHLNIPSIRPGEALYMVGHPSGLPQKITTGGVTRKVEKNVFITNLDAYAGNSGSPVFNQITHLIEGVLVYGEQDFNFDNDRSCSVSNRCKDNKCIGEGVSLIPKDLSLLITRLRERQTLEVGSLRK